MNRPRLFASLFAFTILASPAPAAINITAVGVDLHVTFTEQLTFRGLTNGGLASNSQWGLSINNVFTTGRAEDNVTTTGNSIMQISSSASPSVSNLTDYNNSGRSLFSSGTIGINDLNIRWSSPVSIAVNDNSIIDIFPGTIVLEGFADTPGNIPNLDLGDQVTVDFFGANGISMSNDTLTLTVVPEPSTAAFWLSLAAIGVVALRRSRD